jgi:hypothetical protein
MIPMSESRTAEYMAPEQEECSATCDCCGSEVKAGEPIHTATALDRYDAEEEDLHEREVRWCSSCDTRGAGLRRGMGRTVTRVHRCGCGCVELADEDELAA